MYQYWAPVAMEEHCLFPHELAKAWEIFSLTKPFAETSHDLLISALLKKVSDDLQVYPIFYETKHGLKRVYPASVYNVAYNELLSTLDKEENISSIKIGNNNYHFAIGEEQRHFAMMQKYPKAFDEEGELTEEYAQYKAAHQARVSRRGVVA